MFTLDNHMLALGSCIAGIGILGAGLLALLFRHPDAPRWTRPEIVPMLACVPVTATIGLGLGYTAFGLSQLANGTGDPRELLALAGVLIGLALLWRVLGIRRRLRAYAATAAPSPSVPLATQPALVIDETPPAEPPLPRSSGRAA